MILSFQDPNCDNSHSGSAENDRIDEIGNNLLNQSK